MTATFLRATALASALGPDLDAAAERLWGKPLAPALHTVAGGAWPYFAIPVAGDDWMKRAEAIATLVAESLQRKAALPAVQWQSLPCIVGSSSGSVGAWDDGNWPALCSP